MACLDAAVVQGYVDGCLGEVERAAAEHHVDDCESCRKLVAALTGTPTSAGADAPPPTIDDSPNARRRSALDLGEMIARYRVIECLGAGGMGIVYSAHDPELRRDVAVKLLHPDRSRATGIDLHARLLREAQAMAQVAHPNVIAVYDVGTWQGEVFLAMELATGGTLRAWCKQARSPRQIIDAYIAAGRGLAAAHAAGLVHRDFKPDNVLVGADGRVRVTDFGLARSHDAPPDPRGRPSLPSLPALTVTGTVMGTPGYMSPEVYAGEPADAGTDQFAFCVALWEALYGERPFAGADEAELAAAVKAGRIVDPPPVRGVTRAVEHALRRGLEPEPGARWPTMDALLAELAPPPKRMRLYAAALALVATGGVAVAMWPASPRAAHATAVTADAAIDALDPKAAQAAKEVHELIDHAQDAFRRGRYPDANHDADAAVARARASSSSILLIDALVTQGELFGETGAVAEAEHTFREARGLAEASGDDARKNIVASDLSSVLTIEGKLDEAQDVRAMSTATAARRNADDPTRAAALESEAAALTDVDQATAKFNEALVLRDKLGKVSDRAANRVALAGLLANSGHRPQARDALLASLEVIEQHPGSDPVDADYARMKTLSLLAVVENRLYLWADAEAHARRHIAIAEARHGKSAPVLGEGYVALGAAIAGKGDLSGGEAAFDRALALFNDAPLRQVEIEDVIVGAYYRLHRYGDGVRHAASAVELCTKHLGTHNATTLGNQIMLGWLLVADHQLKRAAALAEKLIPAAESAHLPAGMIGEARLTLARALPKTERTRARALAEQARDELKSAGTSFAEILKLAEQWLADPDAPLPSEK